MYPFLKFLFAQFYRYKNVLVGLKLTITLASLLLGVVVLVGFGSGYMDSLPVTDTRTRAEKSNRPELVRVETVIDGDTIRLEDGRFVRYIGIDSPEKDECFYRLAQRANAGLVAGKELRLEKDISDTDKYGRLLRYVWVGESFINEKLVAGGFARSVSVPPDLKYNALFITAEREAAEKNLGLWEVCE